MFVIDNCDRMAVEERYVLRERREHPYLTYDGIQFNPDVLKECLEENDKIKNITERIPVEKIRRIYPIGGGTSYFAAIAVKYALERVAEVPTASLTSFGILHYPPPDISSSAVMGISFSGRTKITVDAIKAAKEKGAYTIAVTGNPKSPMVETADIFIQVPGGPEKIPVMTRSYTSEVFMGYLFSVALREKLKGQDKSLTDFREQLNGMSKIASAILKETEEDIIELGEKYSNRTKFYFVGGGPNLATALEAALKAGEMGQIPSPMGLETEEMCHGPFTTLEKDSVVVMSAPPGKSYERNLDIVRAAKKIGSDVISLVRKGEENTEFTEASDHIVEIPEEVDESFTPVPYIIPQHLLDYYLGLKKGISPDTHGFEKPGMSEAAEIIFPPGAH